jgi:hypothetical protein
MNLIFNVYPWNTFLNFNRTAIDDQIQEGIDIPCNTPVQPCEEYPDQVACKYRGQIDIYEMEADLAVVSSPFPVLLGIHIKKILQCCFYLFFLQSLFIDTLQINKTTLGSSLCKTHRSSYVSRGILRYAGRCSRYIRSGLGH